MLFNTTLTWMQRRLLLAGYEAKARYNHNMCHPIGYIYMYCIFLHEPCYR